MLSIPTAPSAASLAPKLFRVMVAVAVVWWIGKKRRRR